MLAFELHPQQVDDVGLADDVLRLAVRVGGVDEVDSGVESAVDDPRAILVVGVAAGAEHHRAEAQLADPDARASEGSIVHGVSDRGSG